jgi:spermidine/putrescine transport system permease protein
MKTRAERKKTLNEWLITLPPLAWLTLLFVIPTLIVFAITFKPVVPGTGDIGQGWTLATFRSLGNPNYPAIIWRTLWISLMNTVICTLLAVPAGYFIARLAPRARSIYMMLVIIPFWTSFLIRIFAWKTLLHPEGAIHQALAWLHLINPQALLLYNAWTVLLVMVYTHLPFAILPVYAASEKFDFRLLEAARDLGATPLRAFFAVFLPGIRRGLVTAILVVLIPSLGSYVIPDLMGGPSGEMIGNKIAQRTFVDRNLPHASGLAALLTIAVLIPMAAALLLQNKQRPERMMTEDA